MDKNDIFLLNLTLHFVSDNGWEYEVHRKRSDDKDKNFYLWTIDDDLICVVPSMSISNDKVYFKLLYNFVKEVCDRYEKENGRV